MPRIVTFNVRHCRGGDGRVSLERVVAALAPLAPDFLALQELDAGVARSGRTNQPALIADALGMVPHFHPTMKRGGGLYGIALLSKPAARVVRRGILHGPAGSEPRGAVWIEAPCDGARLQVIGTHLGVRRRSRMRQVQTLAGPDWLGAALAAGPTILAGDFNSVPRSAIFGTLAARLRSPSAFPDVAAPGPTFPARWPLLRLDHVFAGPGLCVTAARVVREAGLASDHLPLAVDFAFEPPG